MNTKLDLTQFRAAGKMVEAGEAKPIYFGNVPALLALAREQQEQIKVLLEALNEIASAQQSHRSMTWVQLVERARDALAATEDK